MLEFGFNKELTRGIFIMMLLIAVFSSSLRTKGADPSSADRYIPFSIFEQLYQSFFTV